MRCTKHCKTTGETQKRYPSTNAALSLEMITWYVIFPHLVVLNDTLNSDVLNPGKHSANALVLLTSY